MVRERDLAVEAESPQRLLGGELVRRVRVRVEKRDRDRVDALLGERRERSRARLERSIGTWIAPSARTRSVIVAPQAARDERRGRLPEQVVRIVAVAAADLEHVAEAAGREQADDGAAALEQRVQPDRRAVQEERRAPRRARG